MTQVQILNRCWETFKDRLCQRWEGLQGGELDHLEGNFEQISELIQGEFGESRQVVQGIVDTLWFEIYVRSARQSVALNCVDSYAKVMSG